MVGNLGKIHNEFSSEIESKPDVVINLYNKYTLTFNNINEFKSKDELLFFIEITWIYLKAIFQKDYYNETIDVTIKKLQLINKEIERLKAPDLKNDTYNAILLIQGMATYNLKDYKNSTPIFKYLSSIDPKNDNFRNWLNYSSYGQKLWLVNSINILCGLLIIIYFFSKEIIEIFEIRISILGIAMLGLFSNWGYEYYIKKSFRKTTEKKFNLK